jgi:hypothetical protein
MFCNIPTNLLFAIVLLCFCQAVIAQKHSVSYGSGYPSSIELGEYKPRIIKSPDAIPNNVRSKVENHLRARFGNDYYSRLVFSIGSAIDIDEFLRVNPNTKWKVHSYELAFKYADRKSGLKEYYARIRLDSNGDVIREINLPEVAKYPQKANIISVDRAIDIAKSRGLKPKKMNIAIDYDEDVGSLVWVIDSFAFSDVYTITSKVIKIDAHSAAILKDGYLSGIK